MHEKSDAVSYGDSTSSLYTSPIVVRRAKSTHPGDAVPVHSFSSAQGLRAMCADTIQSSPSVAVAASEGHPYNLPPHTGAASREQWVRLAFSRRAQTTLPSKKHRDTSASSPSLSLSALVVDSDSLLRSPPRIAQPPRDEISALANTYTTRILSAAVPAVSAWTRDNSAAMDLALRSNTFACAIAAEVHGRLIAEHAAAWMREDTARQELCLREAHARRALTDCVTMAQHAQRSAQQHAARMAALRAEAPRVAEEEREALQRSVAELEAREADLLQRVHIAEIRARQAQRAKSIDEQQELARIHEERGSATRQLRALERRLQEGLEQRKSAVLRPFAAVREEKDWRETRGTAAIASVPRAPLSGAFGTVMREASAAAGGAVERNYVPRGYASVMAVNGGTVGTPHPLYHRIVRPVSSDY